MSYQFYSLPEILDSLGGKTGTVVKYTETGALLFTDFGARLLGLFPSRFELNTLWVAPDLRDRIAQNSWVTGGERLWVSPQRNFYFENPRDFEGFHVSPEIDPGVYKRSGELSYESQFCLMDFMRNLTYNESIARREFQILEDPYKTDLCYAGVRINDFLSINHTDVDVSAWSITQVPTCGPNQPGTALFPLRKGSSLISYFDPIPDDRVSVEHGYARFLIDSQQPYKLGVRPEDVVWENKAKIVYVAPFLDESCWYCLVKRSDDLPRAQCDCVDPAISNPSGPRGTVQLYNHFFDPNYEYLPYGEIELQFKKGKSANGKTVCEGFHELLGYSGTKDQILKLARSILQIDTLPEIY